jgi:carboxylesterase type B
VLLHYAAGVTRRQTVTLSSKLLAEFGVDRHSSYRALQALEVAALVRVQRRKGKKPLVTIVPLEPSTAEALDHVGE